MYSYLDILRVTTFAPGVFNRDQWSQAYDMNMKDRVTTTWTSSDLHAVAFLEDIVWCNQTKSDINNYFSDSNFKSVIFQNYQDVEKTTECSKDNLRLYEFTGKFSNNGYLMFQWEKPDDNDHVLTFSLVFPSNNESKLKEYAGKIFPELYTCQ